jgi:hypothetical protein
MENDRNAPATKGDVQDSRSEIVETMRDIQTELLKAFYSFGESNRQRVTQLEGNQAALITRLGVLEDRMLELERKVNFPQHPAQ